METITEVNDFRNYMETNTNLVIFFGSFMTIVMEDAIFKIKFRKRFSSESYV